MLTEVPCPLCGEASRFLSIRNPYPDGHLADQRSLYGSATTSQWKACGTCGFVHQNPRPSIEALNAFYAAGDYHASAPPPLSWREPGPYMKFARWYYSDKVDYAIAKSGVRRGRVFEMGFGYGGALKLFAERGFEVSGREPDGRLAEFARDTLGLVGPERGFVDASVTGLAPVDLIFSNHAFEHVADLHGAMAALRSIMKPGGHIFTAVPTYAANRSSMSRRWMNSAHYSMFTRASLDQMMARYGFEPVVSTYRGWRKEIDDVWHLARYTGATLDPRRFYEDPDAVARFANWVNPIRAALFYPVFSNYPKKVQRLMYLKEGVAAVARVVRGKPFRE
jgi:SAM-dependent methyltransferase